MFWYIGALLAGFAVGYLAAQITRKLEKTGYCRWIRDCRNCKHSVCISYDGWITCDLQKYGLTTSTMPKYCSKYKKIEDKEDKMEEQKRSAS